MVEAYELTNTVARTRRWQAKMCWGGAGCLAATCVGPNRMVARYIYGILFLFTNILAWMVRDYSHKALSSFSSKQLIIILFLDVLCCCSMIYCPLIWSSLFFDRNLVLLLSSLPPSSSLLKCVQLTASYLSLCKTHQVL